jgi:hypothetical protein
MAAAPLSISSAMAHAGAMRWLRLLTLWVFLIGSWQGAAVHAAQMLEAGPAAAQAVVEQPAPPCHSMQHASIDSADQAPALSSDPADGGDCCHSGHCDCMHANPATLEFDIALHPAPSADSHPSPASVTLLTTAVDTPLRPPTI